MNFSEFTLHDDLMKGIQKAGYETCTPVQEQVLSLGLGGSDLYVQSQTGTGKTCAFLTLMLQQLLSKPELAGKKALIMVPTRELAVQVEEEARTLASGTTLRAASFYGGVGYEKQKHELKNGVDILVGTPGRLIDLQESGDMDLSRVAFLVVDEADRMFDMGFYPDLRKLIKVLPATENRQTMLFSATLNTYVKNLAWEYTNDAKEITIEPEHVTIEEIDQVLLHVSSDEKVRLLVGILQNEKPESVIVFCNTKRSCEVIAKRLKINGIEAEFIIGDLPQSKRLQVLESFKRGNLSCLVATDVAARGIDVDDLAMVVNYDLPNEAENYVHRIGRTARAGKSGKAYTFCSEQDVYNLPAIERYIGNPIPATMPTEDMLAEDKSRGVYIKTNRYDDDERDGHGHRDGHGARGRGDRGRGRDRDDRRERDGRGSRDGHSRSNRRDRSDRRDRSQNRRSEGYNRSKEREAFQEDLSGLSFDERMKIYKEKYGQESAGAALGGAAPASKAYSEGGYSDHGADSPRGGKPQNKGGKKSQGKKGGKSKGKQQSGSIPRAPKGTTLGGSAKGQQGKAAKGGASSGGKPAPKTTPKAAQKKQGGAGVLGIIQKLFGGKKK